MQRVTDSTAAMWMMTVCICMTVGIAMADPCAVNNFDSSFDKNDIKYKRDYFDRKMHETLYDEGAWPGKLDMLKIFTESMSPTEEHVCDEFPEGRQKLIHSVGAGAWMEYVSVGDHAYTGLFRGASSVIGRISMAAQPGNQNDALEAGFIPGAALKMLRSGRPSGNFPIMRDVKPQDDWNPFKYNFSNHVSGKNLAFTQKVLASRFRTVSSEWALFTGLSDIASYSEDGTMITDVKFPFQLIFKPVDELNKMNAFGPLNMVKVLKTLSIGQKLWTVYALSSPSSTEMRKIAEVFLRSRFVASDYLDHSLFYKHQLFDEDLAFPIASSWPQGSCPNDSQCKVCPVDVDCPPPVEYAVKHSASGCPFLKAQ